MGNLFSCCCCSRSEADFGGGIPVVLNIYDLTPLNSYMRWCGFGIFHSGIEVHGQEYAFGAHDYPSSGVFEVEPRSCLGFVYRCSILLGYIDIPPSDFRSFIEHMAADYHGNTYQLISKNCNHFTGDLCWRLTGKPIPGWVNRLARLGACCNCLLPESLRVPAVKHVPDSHGGFSEDSSETLSVVTALEPAEGDVSCDQEKRLLSPSSDVDVVIVSEAYRGQEKIHHP